METAPTLYDVLLAISLGQRRFEPAGDSAEALQAFQWVMRVLSSASMRGMLTILVTRKDGEGRWISAEVEGISDYGAEYLAARE